MLLVIVVEMGREELVVDSSNLRRIENSAQNFASRAEEMDRQTSKEQKGMSNDEYYWVIFDSERRVIDKDHVLS